MSGPDQDTSTVFWSTENERAFFLAIAEVDWIEAARNYIMLHAGGKTHSIRGTLEALSKKLDPAEFVRVNRSAIVRLDSIRELQPWFHGEYKIVMKDGAVVTWSRRFVTAGLAGPDIEMIRPTRGPGGPEGFRDKAQAANTAVHEPPASSAGALRFRCRLGRLMDATPGGTRYSPLTQVTRQNVASLKPVWEYHTGALVPETHLKDKAAFEATPIMVDGTLYLSTPFNQVIALDPVTGKERWVFDPEIDRTPDFSEVTSRGVSTWVDSKSRNSDPCHRRIFSEPSTRA